MMTQNETPEVGSKEYYVKLFSLEKRYKMADDLYDVDRVFTDDDLKRIILELRLMPQEITRLAAEQVLMDRWAASTTSTESRNGKDAEADHNNLAEEPQTVQ